MLSKVKKWVTDDASVQAAVLFGSGARSIKKKAEAKRISDWDFHIVAKDPKIIENTNWAKVFPDEKYCIHAVRPATGGVKKTTIVYDADEIDIVIVSAWQLRVAGLLMATGIYMHFNGIYNALNEMATCLHSGYSFIKGERKWGGLYARIAKLQGVRLANSQIEAMARVFLCDLLWVLQKLERDELIAAQHSLHGKLLDTNLRFWRELRKRRGDSLLSFGLGRDMESLTSSTVGSYLFISAHANRDELCLAAWKCFDGMKVLMVELIPNWSVPASMGEVLKRYR